MRAALCALALAACQPTSQILLHVDSDAVVPPRPTAAADATRPPWLFDRLRAELFIGGVAAESRDFEVDEGLFQDGKVSFGVAARPGDAGVTVRLRLFRGDHVLAGQPPPLSTLDSTYALPAVDASSVVNLTARLHTDDVGLALGPLVPEDGEPGASAVGSWPGAAVTPCKGAPASDEVCVPGGAFWMGDPIIQHLVAGSDSDQERLVVMSPFYLDVREVSVADIRAHSAMLTPGGFLPSAWNESSDPAIFRTWCTFTPAASAADPDDAHLSLALNCVDYETAFAYCRFLGKTLPTEAQFEFAASGVGAEHAYAWGDDDPECGDAVFALGGIGVVDFNAHRCRTDTLPVGTHAPGGGARDRAQFVDARSGAARVVVDLGGNVMEWMLDIFLDQSDAFWSAPGVRKDPISKQMPPAGSDILHTARGGSWTDSPIQLRAGFRRGVLYYDSNNKIYDYYNVGFRCARKGT